MPATTTAAAAWAYALRENSGFDVYERVAPFGRLIVMIHIFSTEEVEKEKRKKENSDEGALIRKVQGDTHFLCSLLR